MRIKSVIAIVMRNKVLLVLFFVLLFLSACKLQKKTSQKSMGESTHQTEMIKQTKKDLVSGVTRAMCYSGFRSGQHPDRGYGAINPSYEEVFEDLKIISDSLNCRLIRIYDSGENSELILKVIRDNKIDIKVMLGIWLRAELSNHLTCSWLTEPIPKEELDDNKKLNILEIEKGIDLANEYKDIVIAVNVGNEALVDWNDHKVDTDTIISYVQKVKQSIGQEVTVADNYKWWADNGVELAKEVDFISLHVYPIWEGKDINEGLSYTIENITEVRNAIPEVRIVITEAGWASVASEFGDRASEQKQQRYFGELMQLAKEKNITTFWFEAFDEDWKGETGNAMGAEKHWGLYTVDRKPKKVIKQLYIK